MSYKDIPGCRPGSHGNTRLLREYGGGSEPPRQSYPAGYANGGAVKGYVRGGAVTGGAFADGGAAMGTMDGADAAPARPRLDRGAKKKSKGKDGKKGTNVNVIVMPKEAPPAAGPIPVPPGVAVPPGGPAVPPVAPPMPPAGGPPLVPPMRARGGAVKGDDMACNAGCAVAGSGKSRMDKMKGKAA